MSGALSAWLTTLPGFSYSLRHFRAPAPTYKDIAWQWNEEQEQAFCKVKKALTVAPVLRYFDKDIHPTVQCDASQTGLGAVLLQQDQPVSHTSRRLTGTEERYAQIEKELLAIVFALKKVDQYTYGRPITVMTDHKPLEIIAKKPLHDAPKRLQRMLLALQRYDIDLRYISGKELVLADALSRAPLQNHEWETDQTHEEKEFENICMAETVCLSDPTLEEICRQTAADPTMSALAEVIKSGWPSNKCQTPPRQSRTIRLGTN